MTSILIAAAAALFVTLLFTPAAIRLFRVLGWGQRVREPGPHYPQHAEKMGTPTMGGLMIVGAMGFAYLLSAVIRQSVSVPGLLVLGATIALALLGFLDDLIKVRRAQSLGLGKTAKLLGQAAIALAFGVALVELTGATTELSFIRETGVNLGIVFFVWVFVIFAASSNGVNLTDGLDGLASGSSAMVMAAYVLIAFWQFRHACQLIAAPGCYGVSIDTSLDLAILAAAGLGAVAGFLWWNAGPHLHG